MPRGRAAPFVSGCHGLAEGTDMLAAFNSIIDDLQLLGEAFHRSSPVISSFFPLHNLKASGTDCLTAWFVLVMVGVAVALATKYCIHFAGLMARLLRHTLTIERVDNCDLSLDHSLKRSWESYSRTFVSCPARDGGTRLKTRARAMEFFQPEVVMRHTLAMRFWNALPGLFVALGILGTFLGLTLGIQHFEVGSTDQISQSISGLLGGMGTAFTSSVWGMLISILWTLGLRSTWVMAEGRCLRLGEALDRRFLISGEEESCREREGIRELMWELLVEKVGDAEVYPSHVMRDLLVEAREQSRSLKQFSDDLADGVKISAETMLELGDRISSPLGKVFEEQIAPVLARAEEGLANLNATVQEIRGVKEESSAQAVEQAAGKFTEAISQIGADFQEALSGSVVKQLEQISSTLEVTERTLETLPVSMQELVDQQKEQAASVKEVLKESRALVDDSSRLTAAHADSYEKVVGVVTTLENMMGQFGDMVSSLREVSKEMDESLQDWGDAGRQISEQNASTLAVLQETIGRVNSTTEKMGETIESYQDGLQQVEEGLRTIFDGIKEGLVDYRDITKDSLNRYLEEFATSLAKAAGGFNTSVEEMKEIAGDLGDFMDAVKVMAERMNVEAVERSVDKAVANEDVGEDDDDEEDASEDDEEGEDSPDEEDDDEGEIAETPPAEEVRSRDSMSWFRDWRKKGS